MLFIGKRLQMKKFIAVIVLSALSGCVFAAQSANTSSVPAQATQTLKNRIVTVPAGNSFRGVFLASLSSLTAYAGQEVTVALVRDFYYGDKMIAPAGSSVTGTVIEASRARHGSIDGKLTLRFTHILTPYGADIPISAIVKTEDNSGILIGDKKWDIMTDYTKDITGEDTSEVLLHAAPVHVNSILRGNNTMPALGSGGGLVKSIWDKGGEVDIPVNTSMEFVLTQPITINPLVIEN